MQIKKIGFKIQDFSGSDPDHTPQELLIHTPFATGWQSERFCPFPQHLTLRLTEGFHRIFKIQILLHHYKIPTRLELLVSTSGNDNQFQKLGYVSIADNSQNSFKARELKTIYVDVKTNLVRINCFKCHVNGMNLYNQVGIVAINILGCPVESGEVETVKSTEIANAITRGIIERSFADENTPIDSDLNFIDHDRFVVHALASIASLKKDAVRNENYPMAKFLKKLQEDFNSVSAEISVLLAEKRSCLTVEDYDKAQAIQAQVQSKKDGLVQQLDESGYELKEEGLTKKRTSQSNALSSNSSQNITNAAPKSARLNGGGDYSHSEAPIRSKYVDKVQDVKPESRPGSARDSDVPKPLSREEEKEFASCIAVFGNHCISCILSPLFNHREEGMRIADALLKDSNNERDQDEVVKATFQILALVGADSRERSHALMINLFYSLIDYCQTYQYPASTFVDLLASPFPLLLNKVADMNPRIKQRSLDLIMRLCELYHSTRASVLPLVTVQFVTSKMQSIPWKHIKSRLDITVDIIKLYGLSDGKNASPVDWTSNEIAEFTKPFITHTNQEVRDAATLVLAYLMVHSTGIRNSLNGIPQSSLDAIQKKFTNINQSESKKMITSPNSSPSKQFDEENEEFEKKCIFCGLQDESFTLESLDTHYWKDCPVLVQCVDCNTLVEIAEYTSHRLQDCEHCIDHQECSKCGMAIKKTERKEHLASSDCKSKNKNVERCPLCLEDCKAGIISHLINAPGCTGSGRKPSHPAKKRALFGF